MTTADLVAVAGLAVTVLGTFLAVMRWIIKNAVKDSALTTAFVEHKQSDAVSFAAINSRLDTGGVEMREIRDQGIRTDAKVDLLLTWRTNPPVRPARATDGVDE